MPGSVNYKGHAGLAAIRDQSVAEHDAAVKAAAERLSEAEREALRAQIVTPPVRRRRGASTEAPFIEPTVEAAPVEKES